MMWFVSGCIAAVKLCLAFQTHDLPDFLKFLLAFATTIPFIFCPGFAIVAMYSLVWGHKQKVATSQPLIVVPALAWIAFTAFFWRFASYEKRQEGLRLAAIRMNRINVALASYKIRNGDYPDVLSGLQTDLSTGMVSYPNIGYRRDPTFGGYELKVHTGFGLNFDSFFYWPNQTYPARIYGGSVELVRTPTNTWAYVNE